MTSMPALPVTEYPVVTLVAGVDSSTQSCKVVIRALETGEIVREGRAGHPAGTEVDPEAWWQALLSAITAAGGLADVAAIAIGGQQHGLVALDAEGRVIRDALLWNDTRSAEAANALVTEIGAGELARRSGSVPVASFTITKLRWLADSEPDNAARIAAIALPHDWLTWRLRGFGNGNGNGNGNSQLCELVTDRSDASGTGYFDPESGDYDRELLALALRIPVEQAAQIVLPVVLGPQASRSVNAGEFAGALRVGAGAGDNAAAALGIGAVAGDVIISIGTSGTVFAVSDRPSQDDTGTVAGFADASGRYLPLIATLNAARVFDSFTALLATDHAGLGELALQAKPGANGAVLHPYFEGERTPNLPHATATLAGLTLASTTRENLARASIEGVLCGLADGLDAVKAQGVTVNRLLLIGGSAQNAAVSRIAAQVFVEPVVVPELFEFVAAGAAVQAGWALTGTRPVWPIPAAAQPPQDYRPIIRAQYSR